MNRYTLPFLLLSACGTTADPTDLGTPWQGDSALPADQLAPPTMDLSGVLAAAEGSTITWRVSGGGLADSDLVILGLGLGQGAGFCPASAFGNVCLDIVRNVRVLQRSRAMTLPTGEVVADFTIQLPSGVSGDAYVQAFRATGPASETSNVRPLHISSAAEPTIFVTNTGYKPGTPPFIGIAGADDVCRAEAAASGMPFPDGWYALLSARAVGAKDRGVARFPLYNVNLDIVSMNATDLWDGDIDSEIPKPNGGTNFSVVWTGTNPDGTSTAATSVLQTICEDWTATNAVGDCGRSNETDSRWASVYWPNSPSNGCNNTLPLYCVMGTACPEGTIQSGATVGSCVPAP